MGMVSNTVQLCTSVQCSDSWYSFAGFTCSSVEGRAAVEFFDNTEAGLSRKYAFKCHRQVVDGIDTVYPVNSLAFHPM